MAEIKVAVNASGAISSDLSGVAKPGDVIILEPTINPIEYVYLGPLRGAIDNPIIIRNMGGQVRIKNGFDQTNCQEVKIAGDGDSNVEYGFGIDSMKAPGEWRSNAGISIAGYAKGIEVSRVSVNNSQTGAWIKNEPSCNETLNAHIIERILVHNCKVTNVQIEGIYCGSTNILKGDANIRPLSCNNLPAKIIPPLLKDIRINDNIFDSTGRGAIQMSFAALGVNEILRNRITNVGKERLDTQGNGVNIGTLSRVRVADNYIRNTLCAGIANFGAEAVIENNDIDLSGFMDDLVTPWAWAIWIDTRETQPFTQSLVKILNNKIGKRGNGANATLGKWFDIFVGDQFGDATAQNGWLDGNIISGNISTITGKEATLSATTKFKYTSGVVVPPPPPPPAPVPDPVIKQVDRGYYTSPFTGTRKFFLVYEDSAGSITIKKANAKYQPLT